MDTMQYSSTPAFQGIQPVAQQVGSYDLSVEEIAFSMRQHLFDPTTSTTTSAAATAPVVLLYQQVPGPSMSKHRIGAALATGEYYSDDDIDDTNPYLDCDNVGSQQFYQNETFMQNSNQHPSTKKVDETTLKTLMVNGHSTLSHLYQQQLLDDQEVSYQQPNELQDVQQKTTVSSDYPRLKSKFYEDLRQKFPKAFKNQTSTDTSPTKSAKDMSPSTAETEENGQSKCNDMSPRYLPRPPNESPRSITRNSRSLREAARLLLNQSRQNLSSTESEGEKSVTESPNSVKDRLRENKERMKQLLQSPTFGKYKDKEKDKMAENPSDKDKPTNGIHKEVANIDKLKQIMSGHSGFDNVSDSGIDGTGQSTSRSVDSCRSVGERDVGSYQLRRHASGGCLVESRNKKNREAVSSRGYHTADSDTDSGISRSDNSWHGTSNRRESSQHKQLAPSREALRMLQKRRDSHGSQSGSVKKPVMGPMKADHNIQPYVKSDESQNENFVDSWLEQGARPKHSSSTESLTMESETVRHEYFQDTPIRSNAHSKHNKDSMNTDINESLSDTSDYSNPAYRGRQNSKSNRTESPCRSVRFEDTDSDGCTSRPRSRTSSHNGSILKEPGEPKRTAPSLNPHPRRHSSYNSYSNPVCDLNNGKTDSKTHKKKGSNHSGRSSLSRQDSDDKSLYLANKSSHRGRSSSLDRGRKNRSNSNSGTSIRDSLSRISAKPPAEPIYSKVDKSRKHRSSSQPPERRLTPSRQMVGQDSWSISSNPCLNDVFDDGLLNACEESSWDRDSWVDSDLSRQSNLSGSRSSLASRASLSEKVSSLGRATKKKFSSMRRALSLDRLDKPNTVDEPPKMRKSPSLRSITTSIGKKFKRSASSSDVFSRERSGSVTSFSSTSSYTRPRRSTFETDVTVPTHLRKVGRLLQLNEDGTQVIELVKPPSGPFGFYIAKGKCNSEAGVFVTRLSDGHPEKILLGLIHVGDEILSINDVAVSGKSIDAVYDIILENERLIIKILPLSARS
ncbi:uncharacterized protein [Antedon mediterranea]|uniref:uncharacterized protein n=1 Tax=Antedon mediterranea TaxID=105859 RepID=UPI003AF902B9